MSTKITLSPSDIPGAELSEPYEKHPVVALCWWLLCCLMLVAPTFWKKKKIVDRCGVAASYINLLLTYLLLIDVESNRLNKNRPQLLM